MRTRILFVDDDPLMLDALCLMARPMKQEWETEFIDSGAGALALLKERSFDVVVADMRMPDMNGVDLFNRVMDSYPTTGRIILSGFSDQELVLRRRGAAHQYVYKPCDLTELRTAVQRTALINCSLKSATLQQLITQMQHLPSLPSLFLQIQEALKSPETTVDDIGHLVARDIGMTANLLKLVNSASFGIRRQVVAANEAVMYLGVNTIKSLVLSLSAFAEFDAATLAGTGLERLWDQSLLVAMVARIISRVEGVPTEVADQAFSAGLLHDTGQLVLAGNYSDQYREVMRRRLQDRVPLCVAEEAVFGAHHADVGGHLLALWGLAAPVVEAIALHHTPSLVEPVEFTPLVAVHVAQALVAEATPTREGLVADGVDETWLAKASFDYRLDTWRQAIRPCLTGDASN